MESPILTWFRGSVRVAVRGERIEELLNALNRKGTLIRNIRRLPDGSMEWEMHLADFFRLRAPLKETGCRVHVLARFGLPFLMKRLAKRKWFAVGFFLFVFGLYMLSNIVWQVEVTGNERVDTATVLETARKLGVHPLQWKFRMKDPAELSRELRIRLPGVAWAGVTVQGGKVSIEIVEAALPEPKPLLNPRHLVSSSDAVVTDILAERGRPLVQPNTRVKKGDILISGILGDGDKQTVVAAKGKVFGLVWYEYAVEVPLSLTRKVYTGAWRTKEYALIGTRALQLTGYGKAKFEREESVRERTQLQWRGYALPFGWMKEKVMEVRLDTQQLSVEEARKAGLEQARADVLQRAGSGASIAGQKILHEQSDSGKVYMKVLFEVKQQIAVERPIVPDPALPPDSQGE